MVISRKPEPPLRLFARRYLQVAEKTLSPAALIRHRQCLFRTERDDDKKFIEGTGPLLEFFGEDRKLKTIRTPDVMAYIEYRQRCKPQRAGGRTAISPNSIWREIAASSAVFSYA